MAWTGPPVPITIFVVTNIIICFFNENFPGARLLRLPRLLLISNRSELAPPNARPRKYWCWDLLNPNHQATSWCLQPAWLLVVRVAYLLYFAATLLVYQYADRTGLGTPGDYFKFLTNLSFILFGLTGLLGVAVSVHHLLRGPLPARQPQFLPSHAGPAAAPPAHGAHHGAMAHQNGAAAGGRGATGAVAPVVNGAALGRGDSGATWHEAGPGAGKAGSGGARGSQLVQARSGGEAGQAQGAVHGAEVRAAQSGEWPVYEFPLLYKLHVIFANVDACMALFITCFFWAVFPLQHNPVDPSNPMVHGCHNFFIGLDLIFSRIPLVSYFYQVLWWYGTGYAIVLWSIAGTTGEWVYPMMNWNIPFSLIAYLVMPILPFIAFLIWFYLVVKPRELVGRRLATRRAGALPEGTTPQHRVSHV